MTTLIQFCNAFDEYINDRWYILKTHLVLIHKSMNICVIILNSINIFCSLDDFTMDFKFAGSSLPGYIYRIVFNFLQIIDRNRPNNITGAKSLSSFVTYGIKYRFYLFHLPGFDINLATESWKLGPTSELYTYPHPPSWRFLSIFFPPSIQVLICTCYSFHLYFHTHFHRKKRYTNFGQNGGEIWDIVEIGIDMYIYSWSAWKKKTFSKNVCPFVRPSVRKSYVH